jgi:hypothetical protein
MTFVVENSALISYSQTSDHALFSWSLVQRPAFVATEYALARDRSAMKLSPE